MGVREQEVEIHRNVSPQILQQGLLLAANKHNLLAQVAAFPQHASNMCDRTPFRQDSHSRSAQDIERRFLVLVFRDVLSSEAQQRADVVAGLVWCGCVL